MSLLWPDRLMNIELRASVRTIFSKGKVMIAGAKLGINRYDEVPLNI